MILHFEQYLEDGKVEIQSPNLNKAKALLDKAERRLKFLSILSKETAEFVFEDLGAIFLCPCWCKLIIIDQWIINGVVKILQIIETNNCSFITLHLS